MRLMLLCDFDCAFGSDRQFLSHIGKVIFYHAYLSMMLICRSYSQILQACIKKWQCVFCHFSYLKISISFFLIRWRGLYWNLSRFGSIFEKVLLGFAPDFWGYHLDVEVMRGKLHKLFTWAKYCRMYNWFGLFLNLDFDILRKFFWVLSVFYIIWFKCDCFTVAFTYFGFVE